MDSKFGGIDIREKEKRLRVVLAKLSEKMPIDKETKSDVISSFKSFEKKRNSWALLGAILENKGFQKDEIASVLSDLVAKQEDEIIEGIEDIRESV